MKLAIMQPYFFPYIGYWQLIHAVDRFVIYDDVNYIVRGWVNRNRILINSEPIYITASLHQASQNKKICETDLQPSPVWRHKLVKMIETTYRKSPYFTEVFPLVEQLIRHKTDKLSDYLTYQLRILTTLMGINTEFILSSRCYANNHLSGQARILDICIQEGATTYINSQGGQTLYDHVAFAQCEVELKFLIPSTIGYKQFGAVHVPWLSIIDVMMFNGVDGTKKLLENYSIETGDK